MKIRTTAILAAALLFLLSASPSYAGAQERYQLNVEYAGGSAEPYIVMTDAGTSYTITQPYSWVRDETSRYNLVSYSVDGGDYFNISRNARGDFTLDIQMDSPHTVRFLAVIQYPIAVGGSNLAVSFSPPSPTHDNWFDLNSEVSISVPYVTESAGTRERLVAWSFDRSAANPIAPADGGSDSFTTKITMSRPRAVDFSTKTQHYVNIISDYGTATPSGWYDAGSTAAISVIPPTGELLVQHKFAGWDGAVAGSSEAYSTSTIVDSPKTLVARWTVDYTQLVILVLITAAGGGLAALTLAKKKMKAKLQSAGTSTLYEGPRKTDPATLSEPKQEGTELRQNSAAILVELPQSDKNIGSNNYQNEIMDYALQKSIETLQALRTSGMISDAKFSKVKEELEQSFH